MAEKMLRKERIAIQKLEERVLFDAAGVAEIIEAAEAADALQNPDVQESEAQSEDDASADVVVPPEALVQDHAAAEQGGSAEDVVADALGDADVGVPFADLTDAAEEPVQVKELVVISSEVPDQAQIASQIAENTDVLLLDKGGNPLDVINQFLDAQENVRYETIHVVSHGDAGCFLLDGKVVNAEAVAEDPASWKAIGEHLTEDGDIMIYGCNVAGNEDGKAMISAISELTGADVAASSDAVGATGGWELDFSDGDIESDSITIDNYDFDLATVNYTVIERGATDRLWTNNFKITFDPGDFVDDKGNPKAAEGVANSYDSETGIYYTHDSTGQLVKVEMLGMYNAQTPNQTGNAIKGAKYSATLVENTGTFDWTLNQSAVDKATSSISIYESNTGTVSTTLDIGLSAKDYGLNILADVRKNVEFAATVEDAVLFFAGTDGTNTENGSLNVNANVLLSIDGYDLSVTKGANVTIGNLTAFDGSVTVDGLRTAGADKYFSQLILKGAGEIGMDDVTVSSGAKLDIGLHTVTVTDSFALAGTVTGDGTLVFADTAALTGQTSGRVDMAHGAVVYSSAVDINAYSNNFFQGSYGILEFTQSSDLNASVFQDAAAFKTGSSFPSVGTFKINMADGNTFAFDESSVSEYWVGISGDVVVNAGVTDARLDFVNGTLALQTNASLAIGGDAALHAVVTDSTITDLTVAAGATLNIAEGESVSITQTISHDGIIEGSGTLAFKQGITRSGDGTVQMEAGHGIYVDKVDDLADLYRGKYGYLDVRVTGQDVLFSQLKDSFDVSSLSIGVDAGYFFALDVAGKVNELTVVTGDLWVAENFIAAVEPEAPFADKIDVVDGSVRLGGIYDADHDSANANKVYQGEDVWIKNLSVSSGKRIDASRLSGIAFDNSNSLRGVQLVAADPAVQGLSATFAGGSTIMTLNDLKGNKINYTDLAIYGGKNTESGEYDLPVQITQTDDIMVLGELKFGTNVSMVFENGAKLTVGTAENPGSVIAGKTNILGLSSTSQLNFTLGDNSSIPVLAFDVTYVGDSVITAGDNLSFNSQPGDYAIASAGNGSLTVTAGDNLYVDGSIGFLAGTLDLTAGDNARFYGDALWVSNSDQIELPAEEGEEAEFVTNRDLADPEYVRITLGTDSVIRSSLFVDTYGILEINADYVKLQGAYVDVLSGGALRLNLGVEGSANVNTIAGDINVEDTDSLMLIDGYSISVAGFVTVTHDGTLFVTGHDVGFTNDVLNYNVGAIGTGTKTGSGYKWIHDYLFSDAEYYKYYDQRSQNLSPHSPEAPRNPGSIVIDSKDGKVTFSELVVSGGNFTINSGNIYFNAEFAVSGGNFEIAGGKVFFANDVYVSSVYGGSNKGIVGSGTSTPPEGDITVDTPETEEPAQTADTSFVISGGEVTMAGSLYNWVRIPVGYWSKQVSPVMGFSGPFWLDASNEIHLEVSENSTTVRISGDSKVTIAKNVSNMGIWGESNLYINGNAEVSIGGNFANYAKSYSEFWSGNNASYDYLTNLLGFDKGFAGGASAALMPLQPEWFQAGDTSRATFQISGNARLQVEGETWNGSTYNLANGAWGKTSGGQGWASFTIDSANNKFNGYFTNESHFWINGYGNSFHDIGSDYFMYINDTNSFGTITNSQDLKITNPGAVVLSLVNNGGKVWITGDADGFAFENKLDINGGVVSIESEFGVTIESDINITKGGVLSFTAANDFGGAVNVVDGSFILNAAVGGSTFNKAITVKEAGSIKLSTPDGDLLFKENITNAGDFVLDGRMTAEMDVINSGRIVVNDVAYIHGKLENLEGGDVLIAVGASGSELSSMVNAGKFTNAAGSLTFTGDVINKESGNIVNNNAAALTIQGNSENSGIMTIDGEYSILGQFTNNADVYVYGALTLGKTVNSSTGTIYLEPVSGKHAVDLRVGDLINDGKITSVNDTRQSGDIYFTGKTEGAGTLEGFAGILHYAYTGTAPIVQKFYANSKYDQVTVRIGDAAAAPGDYSKGEVELGSNLVFNKLILDGGNLKIGNGNDAISLEATAFEEVNRGTITVSTNAELLFSGSEVNGLNSSLANYGLVVSNGDLRLLSTTSGDGLVSLAEGKSITYAYYGEGTQTLYNFAEGSATNLVIMGSDKLIATDMTVSHMVNEYANIIIDSGVTLTLGEITGEGNMMTDGFTISTREGAVLNLAGGTLNATIDNAGTVNAVTAADAEQLVFGGSITNAGTFNVQAAADNSSVRFESAISNNAGVFTANASGAGSRVTFTQDVVNASGAAFNAENADLANIDNSGEMTLASSIANDVINNGSGNLKISGSTDWDSLTNNGTVTFDDGRYTIMASAYPFFNNGTIRVADGAILAFSGNTALVVDGTVQIEKGAVLEVSVAGTIDDPAAVIPTLTSGGVKLENVVNYGTITLPGSDFAGNGRVVLEIGTLNNGDAASGGTLNIQSNSDLIIADPDGDLMIYGTILLQDNAGLYFNGRGQTLGVVSQGNEKFSELNITGDERFDKINVIVDGDGTAPGSLTIDRSDAFGRYTFTTVDGSEIRFADGSYTIGGNITIDAAGRLVVGENSGVVFNGKLDVDGSLQNAGSITVNNSDSFVAEFANSGNAAVTGWIADLASNSGTLGLYGNHVEISRISDNTGTIDIYSNFSFVEDAVNAGTINVRANDVTLGTVSANSGNIIVYGQNMLTGNVYNTGSGSLIVHGTMTAENISNAGTLGVSEYAVLSVYDTLVNGGITVNSGLVSAENFLNTGSTYNNGSMQSGQMNNAGSFRNTGFFAADFVDNSGKFADNAESLIDTFNNAYDADLTVDGSSSYYGTLNNADGARVTVSGKSNSFGLVNNAGSFRYAGSGNDLHHLDNTGIFDYSTANGLNSFSNSGTGEIYKDGVIWRMASDEGMNPWFYSDGTNLNFSSLSLLTAQDLRMQNLGPDFLSTIERLAPSDHAEFPAGIEYPDIEAVGYDLDYLAIEEEFNGLFTELEDEEFEDYVSETADEAVISF